MGQTDTLRCVEPQPLSVWAAPDHMITNTKQRFPIYLLIGAVGEKNRNTTHRLRTI